MTSESLLSGHVAENSIPAQTKRAVTVYVLSAGIDFENERRSLTDNVVPALRAHVWQKHGVEFQMIDLSPVAEVHAGNVTSKEWLEFCLQELRAGLRICPHAFVLALIGQNYGHCYPPSVIPASEYTLIRNGLAKLRQRHASKAELLDRVYFPDSQSDPTSYRLQVPQSDEEDTVHIQWEILSVIRMAIDRQMKENAVDCETYRKYFLSDFERLIDVVRNECCVRHCLFVERQIVDIQNYLQEDMASKFINLVYNDLDEKIEINQEEQRRLKDMITHVKHEVFSDEDWLQYNILWKHDQGIDSDHHMDYLARMCEDVLECITGTIDHSFATVKNDSIPDALYQEVVMHWRHCLHIGQDMCDLSRVIQLIEAYLDRSIGQPLVLYGTSGVGKSTLLSKIALKISRVSDPSCAVIIRHIGHTPQSVHLENLANSLSHQISVVFGLQSKEMDVAFSAPNNHEDLWLCIRRIPKNKLLVLLLDDIDSLSNDDKNHLCNFLKSGLPANVKIIVTSKSCDLTNALEVPLLNRDEAELIFAKCLSLTPSSRDNVSVQNVMQNFQNKTPVISVILQQQLLRDNRSSHLDNISGLVDQIEAWLMSLEERHGQPLVCMCLGYLVASRDGLSDCEIVDLLCIHRDKWNQTKLGDLRSIYQISWFWWLQLKHSLAVFLTIRNHIESDLYYIEHSIIQDVVKKRYASSDCLTTQIHSDLAEYFLQSENKISCHSSHECNNLIREDPDNVPRRKRRFENVPTHLYLSGRTIELSTDALFSYDWLYNKTLWVSLQAVIDDFQLCLNDETKLVLEALKLSEQTIRCDQTSMAAELVGRLLVYYNTHINIRKLIDDCRENSAQQCTLIPTMPYYTYPGTSLSHVIALSHAISRIFLQSNQRHLIAQTDSGDVNDKIFQLDVCIGQTVREINGSSGRVLPCSNDNIFIQIESEEKKAIKIHSFETGSLLGQIIPLKHVDIKSHEKMYNVVECCASGRHLCVAVSTETLNYLTVADLNTCEVVAVNELPGKPDRCIITPDGQFVFCTVGYSFIAWELDTFVQTSNFHLQIYPQNVTFTNASNRCFISDSCGSDIYSMHLKHGSIEVTFRISLGDYMIGDSVSEMVVSSDDCLMCFQGQKQLLMFDLRTNKLKVIIHIPEEHRTDLTLSSQSWKIHNSSNSFQQVTFSPDNCHLLASVYCTIYIWDLRTAQILTQIHAPVGVVDTMLISHHFNRLIVHSNGSKLIHVWNIDDVLNNCNNPRDKLTDSVLQIVVTTKQNKAFVTCSDSRQIVVFDLESGKMTDIITHDEHIFDFAVAPSEMYVMVSLASMRVETAAKIWKVGSHCVLKEVPNLKGYCVSFHQSDSFLLIGRVTDAYQASYCMQHYEIQDDSVKMFQYENLIKQVMTHPFLTPNDRFLVMLSSEDQTASTGRAKHWGIVVWDTHNPSVLLKLFPGSFCNSANMSSVIDVRPCRADDNIICVIYSMSTEQITPDEQSNPSYGFLLLDLNQEQMMALCEPFMYSAAAYSPSILFSSDMAFSLGTDSQIFDITRGQYLYTLPLSSELTGATPKGLALDGTAVVYYKGSFIYVMDRVHGKQTAKCDVHNDITCIRVCPDDKTIIVGCHDGSILSYKLGNPFSKVSFEIIQSQRKSSGITG